MTTAAPELLFYKQACDYRIALFSQSFALTNVFRISRGAKTQAETLVVVISDNNHFGWAESVPYARYQESIASASTQLITAITQNNTLAKLKQQAAKHVSGAASNALNCALLDLQAKQQQKSVQQLLALKNAKPCVTAQTLSIDTPSAMAKASQTLAPAPLIKVKLNNQNILEKMTAVHAASPKSRFIIDANESWTVDDLTANDHALSLLNVDLIEQPLPAGNDQALAELSLKVALCADESCHNLESLNNLNNLNNLSELATRYNAINIKLDKTGGLSQAVELMRAAQAHQLKIMLGCMVASSLAMAPISLLSPYADFIDLDGPVLIKHDRAHGFDIKTGMMSPLNQQLWGGVESSAQAINLLSQAKKQAK
ncbi:dipeptide epimerase [Litorilituus sediminis]|uniref:Dipeptide epimerase n=1 Tax=Litorilituus sediminis TaxID=718192 RepID=A0A4P6P0J3_9GAMM|nr:dipeptide epimerase [Litorilituus sediminis]QBG34294.1 dipeptide epimerase [Litorilituus sediminis]